MTDCRAFDERLRAWVLHEGGLREWLREQEGLVPCIVAGLKDTREAGEWDAFQRYVIAALHVPSRNYTATLCEVLDERRDDVNNEDIVDALNEGQEPAAVPCLRRALRWIPETDEDGELARKAVYALNRIGTPEAYEAIREEVTPDLPFQVVEAAEHVLEGR
jgi:HEAT repeat protein